MQEPCFWREQSHDPSPLPAAEQLMGEVGIAVMAYAVISADAMVLFTLLRESGIVHSFRPINLSMMVLN